MTVWMAVRRHWALVLAGLATGALLAFFTVFEVGVGAGGGPRLTLKPLDTYVTNLSAVIDTSAFGLGSSDTDINRLANLAPTYAELLTSEPVLRGAETRLRGQVAIRRTDTGVEEDGAQVSAEAVLESPIVKLSVEAQDRAVTIDVAVAVMAAFQEYLAASQERNGTPVEKRLAIMVVGEPVRPVLASNRRREMALLLLCLPVVVAAVVAYRLESPKPARGPVPGLQLATSTDVPQPVAVEASE